MAPTSTQQPTVITVQYLRAVAAFAVAFFHANTLSLEYFGRAWSSFGAAGVDLFFVISGFIMCMTAEHDTPLDFGRNRIIRIVPLYRIVTLAVFGSQLLRSAPGGAGVQDLVE